MITWVRVLPVAMVTTLLELGMSMLYSVTLGTTVTVPNFEINGANATVSIAAGDRIDRRVISGANAVVSIRDTSAVVPLIQTNGSNITLRIPVGYRSKTTITNTGTNNTVIEQ